MQFVASNGARTSLPIARRTLIPSVGGAFTTTVTSSVGRGVGQISTYNLDVPQGKQDLDVSFHTADASADNKYTFYLIDPNGAVVARATTPTTDSTGAAVADATLVAPAPVAGRWEIDVELNLTVSGNEFTQTVAGAVGHDQAPAAPASAP